MTYNDTLGSITLNEIYLKVGTFLVSSVFLPEKKKLIERKPGKGFLSNKNSLVHIKFSINNL